MKDLLKRMASNLEQIINSIEHPDQAWTRDSYLKEGISATEANELREKWLFYLSQDEIDLLSHSADNVLKQSEQYLETFLLSLDALELETNQLLKEEGNSLVQKIRFISQEKVLRGQGFAIIKRIPVELWHQAKVAAAYLILSRLIGPLRPQNKAGHTLGHVADLGLSSDNPNVRVYQTKERQTFHTDSSDIVGLLCIRPAKEGGISAVVSTPAIFERIKETRPDLLPCLLKPLAADRRGEIPPGGQPYFMIPVFSIYEGYLSCIYQRQYLDSSQRFPDAPRQTSVDVEALNYFDSLCNNPSMQFSMRLEPGDIQLLNNHSTLHDRSAFIDYPEPSLRRHLLRTWIAPEEGVRPLPPIFAQRYCTVEPGKRGGVGLVDQVPVAYWDLSPILQEVKLET